jgi:hypothetical protein
LILTFAKFNKYVDHKIQKCTNTKRNDTNRARPGNTLTREHKPHHRESQSATKGRYLHTSLYHPLSRTTFLRHVSSYLLPRLSNETFPNVSLQKNYSASFCTICKQNYQIRNLITCLRNTFEHTGKHTASHKTFRKLCWRCAVQTQSLRRIWSRFRPKIATFLNRIFLPVGKAKSIAKYNL